MVLDEEQQALLEVPRLVVEAPVRVGRLRERLALVAVARERERDALAREAHVDVDPRADARLGAALEVRVHALAQLVQFNKKIQE